MSARTCARGQVIALPQQATSALAPADFSSARLPPLDPPPPASCSLCNSAMSRKDVAGAVAHTAGKDELDGNDIDEIHAAERRKNSAKKAARTRRENRALQEQAEQEEAIRIHGMLPIDFSSVSPGV